MNLKHFLAKFFIILTAMSALAFNGDNEDVEFHLSTNRIYSPGDQGITVDFSGRVSRRATLKLQVFRMEDPVKFFLTRKNPHSPGTSSDAKDLDVDLADSRQFKQVGSWEHRVTSRDRYWQYESIPVPVKEKGVYLVQAATGGKVASTAIVITELGMVVKQTKEEALAFVVNRRTGEKVPNANITFARGRNSRIAGSTSSDGIARASVKKLMEKDSATDNDEREWGYGSQIIVLGAHGSDFAISDSYFYDYYGSSSSGKKMYLHTDRPVYRPSQIVYYRGIIREITENGTYRNITSDSARIEVNDARGGSIKKDVLPLSDLGTFHGELTLGDEPPLGNYTIQVSYGGSTQSFSFAVEEYKKPEYEVTVTTNKENYTLGDVISAEIKADYYFGSPVTEAQVEYSVYRSRYWRPWWFRSDWAYLFEDDGDRYYSYGSEMIHTGRGTLNSEGKFSFTYKTEGSRDEDYTYRVQAEVVDNSRRSIAGSKSVRVTRGELYVTASTGKYVYKPDEEARVNVETISFNGEKGISAPFDVRVERVWWDERPRNGNGRRDETVWTGSGTTDANGTGSVNFKTGKAGYYTVTVTARDSRGNKIATSSSLYVTDGSYANWYNEGSSVQIIPDRDIYKPGETMSALVIMPDGNIDALITAEGAALYRHQVERLNSTSAIVRMPIEEHYAPMFYVQASAIVGDNFHNTMRRIPVTPESKVMRLEVTPDKKVYKPGESGTVTVRALGADGEPVANTDIAVAIVDEALYAIRPDATVDIQKAFYGTRHNSVSTNVSLNFQFYAQSMHGQLAAGATANEMATSDALSFAAPPMTKAARRDGDMERKDMDAMVQPTLRTDFRDLMFWTPSARTDASGRARLEVKFPDNLTTWRITARGITAATAVGQARAEVIARKDLLVRMETPRFITQGDELVIATTIHNYLSTAKNTKVMFTAEGVELTDRERSISIPADGEQRIDWKIKATKIGAAKLTVKALTNEESDAMELTVPVLPQGVRSGTSGLADISEPSGMRTISLVMPDNADAQTGELSIALSPSAAGSILGALDELIGYPYGCVEQTMSRFLPTAVVADALKEIDVPFDAEKRAELPKMVEKGLARLYNLQHDDGGWGWWEHDETNPFMTAYVMYGMTVAKKAGYPVDDDRYRRGTDALRTLIESRKGGGGMGESKGKLDATTEAYMLYVASFMHRGASDKLYSTRTETLARNKDLNNYGRALLTLAAFYQGDKSRAAAMADDLAGRAEVTATAASWSGKSWHYNWQDDQVETSAFAVKALLETKGETELVKKGIHYLLGQKRGDSWHNTRQTAMVIYALVDYVKQSRELAPDYTMTVRVNGRQVFTRRMTREDIFAPEQQVKVDASRLRKGGNEITIEKSGEGKLYATARLSYYAIGPAVKAADAGFKVEREYYMLRRERKDGQYIFTKQKFTGTVKSGDELLVKVRIVPNSRREYFLLEDPLPAGCEVVTDTEGYNILNENGYGGSGGNRYYQKMIWNWWYADRDVRDEKVAFFAREIEAQPYEFSYIMRAQIPGSYGIMPAVGMLMYYPEVRGNSNAIAMKITE